ncbi:MAG: 30S ribosomal protein S6 [bacterium]|nr:30S ribosomal protein S6 [bacterium]
MSQDTKLYEFSYLLTPETEENASLQESFRKKIEDKKGIILEESPRRKLNLAYLIKAKREAVFGYIKFMARSESLKELADELKKEKNLMRYFLVVAGPRTEKRPARQRLAAGPSAARAEKKEPADIATIDKRLEEILGS